jgi:hypothetical protein
MMSYRGILVAAALCAAALCAAACGPAAEAQSRPEKAPQTFSAAEVLPICDRALVAAMNGEDGARVLEAATAGMESARGATVRNVCAAYILGAIAMLKHSAERQDRQHSL